jgi:hypothetical protein
VGGKHSLGKGCRDVHASLDLHGHYLSISCRSTGRTAVHGARDPHQGTGTAEAVAHSPGQVGQKEPGCPGYQLGLV